MKKLLYILACMTALFSLGLSGSRAQELAARATPPSAFQIPSALEAEHRQLHARLAAAADAGGRTGAAARALEKLLGPHFRKEEQYALPLLGLLPSLAGGKRPDDAQSAIAMSGRLKQELPGMLREHAAIATAVERLRAAAASERRNDVVQFADMLASHAQQEEQIHYPSAVLVGQYLRSML